MLSLCYSQNGMNFLQVLALQEKELNDSSHLDVVEIAHIT